MQSSVERSCVKSLALTLRISFIGLGDFALHPSPILSTGLSPCMRVGVMERTMLSWRIIVEKKLAELSRFKQFLRREDRAVFDDLLSQCRLYVAGGEVFASPVKEISLLFSMIFVQHKRLTELEKRLNQSSK
jgi:hypothetical protein